MSLRRSLSSLRGMFGVEEATSPTPFDGLDDGDNVLEELSTTPAKPASKRRSRSGALVHAGNALTP